jgi:uncharacterized protein YecE (DUF72 family)
MEFGKLDDISGVNWTLPPHDSQNESRIGQPRSPHVLFGSPAWGNKHWIGKIYPKKTPPEKFLYHYSRNFNCIELNTTHYRIPTEAAALEWVSEVPSNFIFCPKVHKDISHAQFGLADKTLLKVWTNFLQTIQSNLGPAFIQLHESFSYNDKALLFQFLENWPSEFELALELRHPSWFQKNTILPALGNYLHKKKISLVITDVAGRRDVLHSTVTVPWTMIRLIGNDLDPSDDVRLNDWANRILEWHQKGLEKAYLMIHQPDDVWTIEFAQKAQRVFSQAGFPNLPKFDFVEEFDLFSVRANPHD